MKVIIVHDDKERAGQLQKIVKDNSKVSDLVVCHYLQIAKDKMSVDKFDLLILDIQLPLYESSAPERDAGLKFIEELEKSTYLKLPPLIICISSVTDVADEYKSYLNNRLVPFIDTENQDYPWRIAFENKIKQFSRSLESSDLIPVVKSIPKIDFCIITALQKEIEPYKEVLSLEDFKITGDPIIYYRASLKIDNGDTKNILICTLDTMGVPSTTALCAKVIYNFCPTYLCMTGICGSISDEVNLGDLVISEKSVDYSYGKVEDSTEGIDFSPSPEFFNMDKSLKQKLIVLKYDEALINLCLDAMSLKIPMQPKMHMLSTASGPLLIKSRKIAKEIKNIDRKISAVDMETYSMFVATEYFGVGHKPLVLSMKCVADKADSEKNNDYQPFGMEFSARYLIELIRKNIL